MQDTIVQGETLNYRARLPQYPATLGWVVTLYLNRRDGTTSATVTATADGDDHLLQASGTTTAAWLPGAYAWEVWAELGTERYRVGDGQLRVLPSLVGAGAGTDTRTDAQKALDNLRAAWLAFTASGTFTAGSYSINGRTMTYRSVSELRQAISAAESDVKREEQAAAMAAGRPSARRVLVRMGRA